MSKHLVLSLGLCLTVASAGVMPRGLVQAADLELKLVGRSPRPAESGGSTAAAEAEAAADSDASEADEIPVTEPTTEPPVPEESSDEPGSESPESEIPIVDDSATSTDDVAGSEGLSAPPADGAAAATKAVDDELTLPAAPATVATGTDTGEEPAIDDEGSTADPSPAVAAEGKPQKPVDGPAGVAPEKVSAPAAAAPAPSSTAKKAPVATPPKKPVLLPGTGSLVKGIGDDFEDEKWQWNYNHPKSSEEQDKRVRGPLGRSVNGRWFEGPKRGTPDVVKRIPLPAPGLDGSNHGLLMATLHAGIPGRVTYDLQQDDLIYNMQKVTGRGIAVADNPSVVVRVYMPPYTQWEKRSGPTFGFRAGCYTHAIITGKDHPDKGRFGLEEYWPGMFVCYEPANAKRKVEEHAYLRIRGGRNGGEIRGPKITETGWWTLGLSFTPDGMVHYFASPGVDELTMDDHITSQFPYNYRTEHLKTFFFNVCTRDDGKTWSTPWVIDDPKVYFIKRQMAATAPPKKR